jgi:hypothetical protein
MERNIYLYWVGHNYKLILILRKLIYLHSTNGKGYKVNLITDKNIHDYIQNIPSYFNKLCPAHQADFVRVHVICDYGGIWLDSDTIVLDSLDSLFDLIEHTNGFFIKEHNNTIWNGIFGSKSNTTLMVEWKQKMMYTLDNKYNNISWCEIGNDILTNLNSTLYENYTIFNGLDNLYPIPYYNCVREFIESPYNNYKTILRKYQPLIVLVNAVYKAIEHKSEEEILQEKQPLNYFINKSLENILHKYVIIPDWIKTYLTNEHYVFAKNLTNFGWKMIELSKLNEEKIIHIKKEKSIILFITYDDFDISVFQHENTFLIYKLDDIFPYKKIRETCINSANILIGPYQYLFKTTEVMNIYPQISNKKSYHISYSAVNEFYSNIDYNNEPINKIFVSGNVNKNYPLRNFIKTNEKMTDFIEILDHPGYQNNTHDIINENYYNTLNKYICCFTDASSFKYILLKVFEICSVGSLLLVEDSISVELNKLGFYDNINCIMCNMNNLEYKIKWILDINNKDFINNIRKNGMKLVRTYHNTQEKSIEFNNLIDNNI